MGGPRALATAALYLVLKSNGLHRLKIRLKKFSFSLKIVPAYIFKKLPSQCWPKPLFIAFFNFSHKRPTFAFTSESGYTLGFRRRIAHKGSHAETGAFPPSSTAGLCAASEIALSAAFVTLIPQRFYIHTFPGSLWPPLSATAVSQIIFHPVFQLLLQTAHVCLHSRKWVHLAFANRIAHSGPHAGTGTFRTGLLSLPSERFTRFGNPAWPGLKTANFAAFGSWPGVLQKNAESLRDSDALMRVAVSKASRPRWAA